MCIRDSLNRYKNLLASEAVTRQQFDAVKTEYEATRAAYQTLLNQKNSATLSTSETKSRIGINDAEIKRAKAAVDMAKLNLSYDVFIAPYDGLMGRRAITEGQLIQAGQQAVPYTQLDVYKRQEVLFQGETVESFPTTQGDIDKIPEDIGQFSIVLEGIGSSRNDLIPAEVV